ncbi:MAG TPA: LiaF domain-containing protein, partial [Thermoanaerobaculia bacterium]
EVRIQEVLSLWPLLISVAGLALVRHALRPLPKNVFGEDASIFRAGAFMSGNAHAIGSRDFAGGEAVACMGGCDIDLRGAELRRDEAVIDVLAFWGGIGIKVPESWTVENRVTPVLGGLDDKTSGGDGKKRLILRGSAIMGGIEVTN